MTAAAARLRRADRADLAFGMLALATLVGLIVLGRGMTFFYDEWSFIGGRGGWDLATFMSPHNEHWSLVPVLIYKVLLATVGLHAYMPYQVVVVILHIVAAAALYRIVRRETGPILALSAGAIFLLLGGGHEDLFWGAQIGWNAATAAGAWALALALDQPVIRRRWLVALLLVISVASSGVGLFFMAAVAVALLTTPARRRQLWVLAPAAVAYAAWYVIYGRSTLSGDTFTSENLKQVPEYVAFGLANAMGRVSGWGSDAGLVLIVLLIVATAWRAMGSRALLVGTLVGVVGVLSQFVVTAIGRARFGPEQAASPRYVYVAAFFILIALASWLATRYGLAARIRPRAIVVLGVLVAVSLASNLFGVLSGRSYFLDAAEQVRASITVLQRFGGSAAVSVDEGIFPIPGRAQLDELVQKYGSPLTDALAPAAPPSPVALDQALLMLVNDQLVVTPTALPRETADPIYDGASDLTATPEDGCLVVEPTGAQPSLIAHVASGDQLIVQSSPAGPTELRFSVYGAFPDESLRTVPAGSTNAISLPDLGSDVDWLVRVVPPASGATRICVTGT